MTNRVERPLSAKDRKHIFDPHLNGTSRAQPMQTNDHWSEVDRTKAADSVTVEATA
jgi:hypothetical protein